MFTLHSQLRAIPLLVLAFASICFVSANPIDALRAQKIAEQFFQSNSTLRDGGKVPLQLSFALPRSAEALQSLSEKEPVGLRDAHRVAGENYYYIFNRGKDQGYVMVAGDDRFEAILGYSSDGKFDLQNAPLYLRGFFQKVANAMESLLAANSSALFERVKPIPTARLQEQTLPAAVQPIMDGIQWDQGYPWNNQCPEKEWGGKMPVGCLATAMAQVMRYYEWPTQGEGSYSYSEYGEDPDSKALVEIRKHSVDYGATTYDYSKMPKRTSDSRSLPSEHVNELAKFCYHVGVSVNMAYGEDGSGSYDFDIPRALAENWRYNKGALIEKREHRESQVWEVMLRSELAKKQPVLYFGYGTGGGHAFIFDGYNEQGLYHVNWGWGGASDGYFNINALNPSSIGIGGGAGGFNSGQACILGMVPDKDGTSKPNHPEFFCLNLELSLEQDHTVNTKTFTGFGYGHPLPYKGYFALGMSRYGAGADTLISETSKILVDYKRRVSDLKDTFKAAKDFKVKEDGLYTIFPMYEVPGANGNKRWVPVRTSPYPQDRMGTPAVSFAVIEVSNGGRDWKMIETPQVQVVTLQMPRSVIPLELTATGPIKLNGSLTTGLSSGKYEVVLTRKDLTLIGFITKLSMEQVIISDIKLGKNPTIKELNLPRNVIKAIDLRGNRALEKLNVFCNKISSIDVSGCDELKSIICAGNSLNKENDGMKRFIETLPSRVGREKGELIAVDLTRGNEQNKISTKLVELARAKGWEVYNLNGNYDKKEVYAGDLAIEDLERPSMRVYPNPASDLLKVEGAETGAKVRLTALDGTPVFEGSADTQGNIALNVASVPVGSYLLLIGNKAQAITIRR